MRTKDISHAIKFFPKATITCIQDLIENGFFQQ